MARTAHALQSPALRNGSSYCSPSDTATMAGASARSPPALCRLRPFCRERSPLAPSLPWRGRKSDAPASCAVWRRVRCSSPPGWQGDPDDECTGRPGGVAHALLDRAVRRPVRAYLRTESGSAGILVAAIVAGLAWANLGDSLRAGCGPTPFGLRLGDHSVTRDLRTWVNSGLMTFFSWWSGLEARRRSTSVTSATAAVSCSRWRPDCSAWSCRSALYLASTPVVRAPTAGRRDVDRHRARARACL